MPKPIRSVVLVATVAFVAASCGIGGGAGTVGPTTGAANAARSGRTLTSRARGGSDSLSLFACAADSVADSASAVIGPLGGQIKFGPHTLIVPPGRCYDPRLLPRQRRVMGTSMRCSSPKDCTSCFLLNSR